MDTGSAPLDWMAEAPAERASLPAAGATWCAAAILHAAHVSALDVALPALTTAGAVLGLMRPRSHAIPVAAALAGAGGWLTLATGTGPLAGPYMPVTLTWLGGSLAGYWCLRQHEAVRHAREWRHARLDWLDRAPR